MHSFTISQGLKFHAEGGEKRLYVGPGGFQVSGSLDIKSDIQGIGGCAGEFCDRFFDCSDQCGERSNDLRSGFESFVRACEPLEGVLSSDFNSLFLKKRF